MISCLWLLFLTSFFLANWEEGVFEADGGDVGVGVLM